MCINRDNLCYRKSEFSRNTTGNETTDEMIRIITTFLILGAAANAALVGGKRNEYELHQGPVYRVPKLQKIGGNCELRKYFPSLWVATSPKCYTQESSLTYGFMKLYFYMNKWNLERKYFPSTQPSVTKYVENADDSDCDVTHQEMFYISQDPNDDAPIALDDGIVFIRQSMGKIYATSYKADPLDMTACAKYRQMMHADLSSKRAEYNQNEYYCARYDPSDGNQDKLRFEVWIPAL